MEKISGKTHTKEQLDNWANQNNPNNKAYQANRYNRSKQLNPNNKAYLANQKSRRRNKPFIWPDWAPDYPEYD
jgi:hypothetical protein